MQAGGRLQCAYLGQEVPDPPLDFPHVGLLAVPASHVKLLAQDEFCSFDG